MWNGETVVLCYKLQKDLDEVQKLVELGRDSPLGAIVSTYDTLVHLEDQEKVDDLIVNIIAASRSVRSVYYRFFWRQCIFIVRPYIKN